MTKINLLKNIGKSKKGGGKGLFGLFGRKGGEPVSGEKKGAPAPKIRRPSSTVRALLFFLLPVIACVSLESLLEDEMKKALEQIASKLVVEEKKFLSEWGEVPPLETWEEAHQSISKARKALSKYRSIDIQTTREYIQQMTEALPQEAWIKRFSFKRDLKGAKHNVEIEGYAFTSETVLLFLSKLKDMPLYRDIVLKFSEPTLENGIQEHRFFMLSTIQAQLFFNANDFKTLSWGYNNISC